MDLTERAAVVKAAKRIKSERYTGTSTTIKKIKRPSATDVLSRIRTPIQKAANGPSDRDKSQLIAMVALADPTNGVFDPRSTSGDLGVISRNASSELYALNQKGQPYITERGFRLAAAELNAPLRNDDLQTEFEHQLVKLSGTERTAETKRRLGQDLLRKELLSSRGRCQVTGLQNPSLLRASHIRPWSDPVEKDRLNLDNVLLLAVQIDACFDALLISFGDAGEILISPKLTSHDQEILGIRSAIRLADHERHQRFLDEHRKRYSAASLGK